jgi:hypothetical protein
VRRPFFLSFQELLPIPAESCTLLLGSFFQQFHAHLPLYRQSEIYAREGVELDRSTLADWVSGTSQLFEPLVEALRRHVMAAQKLHADDTPVPVLAPGNGKGKAGTVIHVCTDEKCKTHRQFSHYEISPQEREQRRKLALAVRVQKKGRSRILQAVRQKLPPALARADFEMVALDYFRRLGHDNHYRLF